MEETTMNKRAIVCLGVVLTVAALPSFGQYGSGGQTNRPEGRHERMGREQSVDDRVKHLTKELNLTEDQQAKVKSALEDEQRKISSLKQDSSLSREDRRTKFEEIRKNTSQQIRAILNEDQQKKYDELQSKRGNWREHGKGSRPPSDQL
jgi:periplasmic protein CpxP/Spy